MKWRLVLHSVTRPYPVTFPMVLLMAIVPFYIFIGQHVAGGPVHVPELPLDRALPLRPAWALIYGCLYLFLILLPVFVVRQQTHIRRTFWTYVVVWLTAYVCFLLYPTRAPRPPALSGDGFVIWGLDFLYSSDPPYNCLPSLHVAHSLVSALTCWRVHRGVGAAAAGCALLVGLSTLFTKQHYVLDVAAGLVLGAVASAVLLRGVSKSIPAADRDLAPSLAIFTFTIPAALFAAAWVVYQLAVS